MHNFLEYIKPFYLGWDKDFEYLKHLFSDKYLYHYTKTSTAIENILWDEKLKFNKLKNMNDPLEFQEYDTSFTSTEYMSWEEFNNMNNPSKLQAFFERNKDSKRNFIKNVNRIVKNDFKICCFCSDMYENYESYKNSSFNKDEIIISRGYNRSRMWSQYAENHNGVCIIFNKEKLLNQLQNLLKNKTLKCLYFNNMQYSNIPPEIYNVEGVNTSKVNIKKPLNYVKENIIEFFFKKLEDYRDENEYRIVLLPKENSENEFFLERIDDCIEGIILGAKFHYAYFLNTSKLLQKNELKPILKIDWSKGMPSLRILNRKELNLTEERWF